MSKIAEKVVCQQLTDFLNLNNVLPQKQSCFRAGRSTSTALLDIVDDILSREDLEEGSILVLLDFTRAFNTINHNLLLSKLSYYGFDYDALKWFFSYLGCRSQRVEVVNNSRIKSFSKTVSLNRVVPQGSILGPILFTLYSADVITCIKYCNYHLYADDLQIYSSLKPNKTTEAVSKITEDLNRIKEWACRNSLVLNPKKCKFLVLKLRSIISIPGSL